MTWWRWVLVAVVVAALLLGGGYHGGVTAERQRGAQRTIALLVAQGELDRAHADTVAKLQTGIVARGTERDRAIAEKDSAVAAADRSAASRRVLRERETVLRGELAAAVGQVDSLAGYAALLPVVTARADTAEAEARELRWGLLSAQDAFMLELERSRLLQERIAVDSAFIVQQSRTIARLITIAPVAKSGGGLGRTVETGAIALATAEACRQSPFSLGCVAGLLVTGNRVR